MLLTTCSQWCQIICSKKSTLIFFSATKSAPEVGNGHYMSGPFTHVDVRRSWTRSSAHDDVTQECANQVYYNLAWRCDGQQSCTVRVENSLCQASGKITSVEVSDYRYQGGLWFFFC